MIGIKSFMKFLIYLFLALILVGCSTITQLGPNTYAIEGGSSVVSSRARDVCRQEEKVMLVTNYRSANEFIFKCLDEDDPEYSDYEYKETPDTVIEDRR